MVGQPELKYKLQRKELCQFAQRVTVSCHLDGLNKDEVDKYIRHRLKVAGAEGVDIFDAGAIAAIASYSRGIPRIINILCDTALVYGYADELKVVDKKAIEHVVKAREAGGISFGIPQDEKGEPSSTPLEGAISGQLENRLEEMARRIRLLEDMVGGIDQRVNTLVQKKGERDTIVLELFKMLKNSMERRLNVLRQLDRFKKSKNMNSKEIPLERNKAVIHPRLHFKKEGKANKV